MKKSQGPVSIVLLVLVVVLGIVLKNNRSREKEGQKPQQEQTDRRDTAVPRSREDNRRNNPPSDGPGREGGFDRRVGKLIYTKHARCRMACRQIDETEVQEILEQGTVNERKSEPAARPDPKYALEGRTHDGQQVRIIFAPSDRGMVVITVIDLGRDWSCDCK
ncbi:DUF4258 domain-containing protein [Paraflavitalea speifideaquila]|uniref:DUF4258 domain-containing protein n=1 Tax=Paraflavitalea speifideaquila TaxID=3076558 RepID=UPI0028EA74D2|nr:DUF4258 domain-containing protein [Paraflavitalea speifideiaquila]